MGRKEKEMTQEARALRYLQTHKKGLTSIDFLTKLAIYRSSDVVYKLRKKGYPINMERKKVRNRYGETCNVAYYTYGGKMED